MHALLPVRRQFIVGTVVASVLSETLNEMGANGGKYMRPVWFGVIFVLVYGLLSMKSQAAQEVLTAYSELRGR